jgi:ABC-type transport system involved in cytochrome bd biosynthesis fused ATPase/permease subunit
MGEYDYARNAGPFWESGAFASFLIMTLFLIYSTKTVRKVSDLFDRQSTILVLGIISTTSTMGFLALAILLSFFTWQLKSVLKYFMLLMIVLTSLLAFTNVSYLGDKVEQQLKESRETNNRFGAFLMDLKDIEKRPLIGSSRRIEVIFKTQVRSAETRRPNGFSNFIRDYGLIYTCVYFALVFASFQNIFRYYHGYSKASVAFFGVLVLCIISFSELLFDLSFFKGLLFLFATYDPRRSPYLRGIFQTHEDLLVEEKATLTS